VASGEAALSIHEPIVQKVVAELQAALIDRVDPADPARAGVVMAGLLQGDPDPDQARISVTVHENDVDDFYGKEGTSAISGSWEDEVAELECGGAITWKRRFTVKARCLLVNTQEGAAVARNIASTVRKRIEKTLLSISFASIQDEDGEYVAKGVFSDALKGEMVQAGGPPDSYDYHIKVRFQVETTAGVQP
jgi:hypothetical protein